MKVNRYIVGLLLFCFSAFLGHSLIPHHHHFAVTGPLATDCPFEHGDQHGHEHGSNADQEAGGHPTHCHAFNDVVFEKYSTPVIKTWISPVLVLMLSSHVLVPELPLVDNSKLYSLLKLPCRSHIDEGTRALRAPPAFA